MGGRPLARHLLALIAGVQVKNLEWEAEVLAQRFAAVQAERDSLYEKFEGSVYDVAQKTGEQRACLLCKADTPVWCWLTVVAAV